MSDRERGSLDIGRELSGARARKNLTLADVSHRTKISVPTLHAIERNEFKQVPGGIFLKGYLRAYAREVGLDPEDVVRAYVDQYQESVPLVAAQAPEQNEQPGRPVNRRLIHLDSRWRGMTTGMGVAAAVLIGAALYQLWAAREFPARAQSGQLNSRAAPPSRSATQRETPPTTGIAGTSAAPAPAVEGASASGSVNVLRLVMQPNGLCWVSVFADGHQSMYRLLAAEERASVDARDDIVLRVGDGAACAFSINGIRARPLAGAGEPKTIHLTPQNYLEFLDR